MTGLMLTHHTGHAVPGPPHWREPGPSPAPDTVSNPTLFW